ncbi:hypothetical protein ECG_07507 [Echinococcus granulosus]|nr:hypothetical protein ECG_07507 [Echinococcus granulosus]
MTCISTTRVLTPTTVANTSTGLIMRFTLYDFTTSHFVLAPSSVFFIIIRTALITVSIVSAAACPRATSVASSFPPCRDSVFIHAATEVVNIPAEVIKK